MPLSREEIEEIASWVRSPTLAKVIKQIEDKYVTTWKLAKVTDDREYCWRMIQCIHQVVSELQGITDAERIEQHNFQRKNFSFNNIAKPEPRLDGETGL